MLLLGRRAKTPTLSVLTARNRWLRGPLHTVSEQTAGS
jgi:hypothetical protein